MLADSMGNPLERGRSVRLNGTCGGRKDAGVPIETPASYSPTPKSPPFAPSDRCRMSSPFYRGRLNSMPIRELNIRCSLREHAVAEESVVLTIDGRPFALLVGLQEGEDPADLDRHIRQARAQCAISAARAAARLNGTDKLTMEEIDAEIRAARADRAARERR